MQMVCLFDMHTVLTYLQQPDRISLLQQPDRISLLQQPDRISLNCSCCNAEQISTLNGPTYCAHSTFVTVKKKKKKNLEEAQPCTVHLEDAARSEEGIRRKQRQCSRPQLKLSPCFSGHDTYGHCSGPPLELCLCQRDTAQTVQYLGSC